MTATIAELVSGRGRRWVLAALFVALPLVMLRPTPHTLAHTLPGDLGDPAFVTWVLAWVAHAAGTDPTAILDANIFWPHDNTLAFSENMIPLGLVFGVVNLVTGNAVLSLNLLALALVTLNLGATFALARRLLGRDDVALIAAFVVAFNSFTLGQQSHVQLQTVGFLPLGFLALFWLLDQERPVLGVWLGLATLAITLNALYYGALWFVILAVLVAAELWRRRGRFSRSLWAGLGIAAVIAGVVLAPLGLVYQSVSDEHGGRRPYSPQDSLLATDLLTPARGNWLWGERLDSINSMGKPGDHGFFMGAAATGLGAVGAGALAAGVVQRRRRRTGAPSGAPSGTAQEPQPMSRRTWELWMLAIGGTVALAVAVGPTPGGVPGPYRVLYHAVPGFSGLRVPSRLAVFTILAGGVLAGAGLHWILERWRPPRRGIVVALVGIVVLAEVIGPGTSRADVPRSPERTAVYEALQSRPLGPVLELPMADPGRGFEWPFVEAPRLLLGIGAWHPRVNGYSGLFPSNYLSDVSVLNTFPSDDALIRLNDLGVDYVILHLGDEQGYPAYTEAQASAILSALDERWIPARHGSAWLLEIGPSG